MLQAPSLALSGGTEPAPSPIPGRREAPWSPVTAEGFIHLQCRDMHGWRWPWGLEWEEPGAPHPAPQ